MSRAERKRFALRTACAIDRHHTTCVHAVHTSLTLLTALFSVRPRVPR